MAIVISEGGSNYPRQEPLDNKKEYQGKFSAYEGKKKKWQSEEIEDVICVSIKLDDIYLIDTNGITIIRDGEPIQRGVFVMKNKPSIDDRSKFKQFHYQLFDEDLTKTLWEVTYQSGDMWIALINGAPVSFYVSKTRPNKTDPTKYFQTIDKIVNFEPNENPDVEDNPVPRGLDGKPITPF